MLDRFKVPESIAVRVDESVMRTTVEDMFRALGMPVEDSRNAADALIYADIRGIDSHGVSNMMQEYVNDFRAKSINPTPTLKKVHDHGATMSWDCDRGLGVAQGRQMMSEVCGRAKETGVAVGVAFNGRHYGASACYAHQALEHDQIGVSMTSDGLLVTPTHGAEPLIGLNPIGIAAPARQQPPFIFDASMSSIAENKIALLSRLGGKVAPGWVSGPDGAPIMTEGPIPEDFMMLPLGGTRELGSHKGFGLAMMVEILCGVLSGTGGGPHRRKEASHYFMAYDIASFTDVQRFKTDMDQYLTSLLNCKPAPGASRVVYPGFLEHEAEIDRRVNGIPYHPEVIKWFKTTAKELGVTCRLV